jgi:RND family efflux transporter MFP subunit
MTLFLHLSGAFDLRRVRVRIATLAAVGLAAAAAATCSGSGMHAADPGAAATVTVGVTTIGTKPLSRQLTVSSELVPFQEIDVYAKESGYVRDLNVDYGSRVKAGDVMAVLEIPELEAQLQTDDATIKNASDRVTTAQHELARVEAQHHVADLQYQRLDTVSKTKAGLVAQQEVDDAQGKELELQAAVDGAKSGLDGAQSALQVAQSNRDRDRALYSYARITAPFAGIVTQRFANKGALIQAGTSSSTQAMPLVRLSEDDLFRLVIPVPESYVRYIHVGDQVDVRVPALERHFPGKIIRFSVDVREDTRTMHTEVDVPNPDRVLIPGVYAEATLMLDRKDHAIAVPLQAVNREGEQTTVYLVGADSKIVDRPVTLGIQTADDAEVLSGLREGDQVVVSDRGGLKVGQTVHAQGVELMKDNSNPDAPH